MKIFIINTMSSLVITAIVIVPMLLDGAPFWACYGVGWIIWMINKTIEWVKYK